MAWFETYLLSQCLDAIAGCVDALKEILPRVSFEDNEGGISLRILRSHEAQSILFLFKHVLCVLKDCCDCLRAPPRGGGKCMMAIQKYWSASGTFDGCSLSRKPPFGVK